MATDTSPSIIAIATISLFVFIGFVVWAFLRYIPRWLAQFRIRNRSGTEEEAGTGLSIVTRIEHREFDWPDGRGRGAYDIEVSRPIVVRTGSRPGSAAPDAERGRDRGNGLVGSKNY
ncbi:Uu.00g100800.m01.CDS01 [Anthostomella pinea]|uniref:Uu.00g100800.m01.CDS01 n=1 Tax=Anthostomella pinea TaxID=933095 RepID=A0AAI8VD06_9PEZI|nr:Uu.00g100800.m01.CDS01 [Anthostomella pinea]